MCWLFSHAGRVNKERLLKLVRLFELTTADFPTLGRFLVNFSPNELPDGLRTPKRLRAALEVLKVVPDLRIARRLGLLLPVWRELDVIFLLEAICLCGLEVFGLARGLLDRGAAVTLAVFLPALAGRLTLGAAVLFLTCGVF
jgi:hypothetical protein